ncbi:MAG: phosphoribosylamine--glycine ligase [Bdellovibrionaceae bacterium]|jgi:phosphoribosylamine---glycine ligase|nr:phosphoribosylamine--glycine ligase [Pseudobdellovibrionaceae bacterium]
MNVLVFGQGGREAAIIRALNVSPSVTEVHVVQGCAALEKQALCHSVDYKDTEKVYELIERHNITFAVIGPEQPLADGLSDQLRKKIPVFGPSQFAAQLESSKCFSKEFMNKFNVSTAKYYVVTTVEETLAAAENFQPPYVLKADGLAAGKGVFICRDLDELQTSAEKLFVHKVFGTAGSKALLEEYQQGWELSYIILTNGKDYRALPLTQDHKRLKDKDEGPNTGGMGVVGPLSIDEHLNEQIIKDVIEPTLNGLVQDKFDYRGALYIGLMMTENGPSVIEYNVRFGDPEAQVIIPLVDNDWGAIMYEIALGELPDIKQKKLHVACVVLASEGYPHSPVKGVPILGDTFNETSSGYFLHAGTDNKEGEWVTNGGRVINALGIGSSLPEAVRNAYAQADKLSWHGLQKRSDIGKNLL